MTKVTMPEPVAWASSKAIRNLHRENGKYRRDKQAVLLSIDQLDGMDTALITTTQAEAYADARVREALEAAAQEVELTHSNSDDQDRFQIRAAEAIRALIPKENKS